MHRDLAPNPLAAILASIQALAASLLHLRDREISRSDPGLRWEIQAACIPLVEQLERLIRLSDDGRGPHCRDAVAQYVLARFRQPDQEVVGALYLDPGRRLLAAIELFRGTLVRTAVEPRAILREAVRRSAPYFVLWHTHPSGNPTPSRQDIAFTRRLFEASELVGVAMLDHLVVTHRGEHRSVLRDLHRPTRAPRDGGPASPLDDSLSWLCCREVVR